MTSSAINSNVISRQQVLTSQGEKEGPEGTFKQLKKEIDDIYNVKKDKIGTYECLEILCKTNRPLCERTWNHLVRRDNQPNVKAFEVFGKFLIQSHLYPLERGLFPNVTKAGEILDQLELLQKSAKPESEEDSKEMEPDSPAIQIESLKKSAKTESEEESKEMETDSPAAQILKLIAPLKIKLSEDEIAAIFEQIPPPQEVEYPTFFSTKATKLARPVLATPEGRYLLLKKYSDPVIGGGASKRIRYAINLDTKKIVALGLIRRSTCGEERWGHVTNEINSMQKMKGKEGIVQLYGVFKKNKPNFNDKVYFIIEYCDLGDLDDYLYKQEDFKTRDLIQIAIDCATGLKNMHEEGLLHRDVHQKNIFLYRNEGRIRAKLGDLGFTCKETDDEALESSVESRACMSPERYRAEKSHNNKQKNVRITTTRANEVWAMGQVFASLFNKNSRYHLSFSTDHNKKDSLTQQEVDREIRANVPHQFQSLVIGMLQCDPNKRMTLNQVLQELETYRY